MMKRTLLYRRGDQKEAITVAARLTGHLLNEVTRLYTTTYV
jgi:hypothetical protein